MNDIDIDKNYIAQCLLLASKGRFSADPNPMVGAIIVKNNKIVGKGYHKRPGSPHAEQMAIKQAGKQAVKSTLYINLEPCCHHGKTPPCSDLIIKNKINLGLELENSILAEFNNRVKSYNFLFAKGVDLTEEFFSNNNDIFNLYSNKFFSEIDNNNSIKSLFIKFANKGLNI